MPRLQCQQLGHRCHRDAEKADIGRSITSQLLTMLAEAAAHQKADTDTNDGLANTKPRRSAAKSWHARPDPPRDRDTGGLQAETEALARCARVWLLDSGL